MLPLLALTLIAVLPGELTARRIPDAIPVALLIAAASLAVLGEAGAPRSPGEIVAAAFLGFAIPATARGATGGGLGLGDVKLSVGLFLLVGPVTGAAGLLIAALLAGAAWALVGARREAGVPFGPYMVAGVFCAVLALW